jgi:hypothetical protein
MDGRASERSRTGTSTSRRGTRGRSALLAGLLMMLALPLFASSAQAAYNVTSHPAFNFVVDESTPHVDDFPGQKDLNAQAVATVPGSPVQLWTAVKWDDLNFSGGNTGDSCALFDTDTDNNANYVVCMAITGSPAVVDPTQTPRVYSCSDKSSTKCTSKSTQLTAAQAGETACAVETAAAETFPTEHPNSFDTLGYCRIDTSVMTIGGSAPDLINTCSYPSSSPTSDPSDCVLIPRDAFIRVVKVTNVATAATFDFSLGITGEQATVPPEFDNVAGAVSPGTTTDYVGIRSDSNYDLSEIVPAGWDLSSAVCANTTGTADSLGTATATGRTNINAKPDGQITCTFTNTQQTGAIGVTKYIDIDESGGINLNGSEGPLGPSIVAGDLTGWSFTISQGATTICTGTTSAAGVLTGCGTGLTPGTYTVTENANAGKTIGTAPGAPFFNTDPGTAPAAAPVSQTNVQVNASGTTNVDFGNTCYNRATFQVTNVPNGTTGLFARYSIGSSQTTTDVNLAQVGTSSTWAASTPHNLRLGQVVHWQFGVGSSLASGADITMPGYPACGASQSSDFGGATLSGTKYYDKNNNGTKDAGEGGLAGITITLKQGGTTVDTTTTASGGGFSFTVTPGSYTIEETVKTGWNQTEPGAPGTIAVTVPVGASGTINTYGAQSTPIAFGNTPKSKIDVSFTSLGKLYDANGAEIGDATKASGISCASGATVVGSSTNSNTATATNLTNNQSPVVCTITFGP